jgi:hypothetical protein
VYTSGTNWVKSATTDAGGAYRIEGLSTQFLYCARTYADGYQYVDEWYDNVLVSGEGIPPLAQAFGVSTATVKTVNFSLDPSGILVGQVSDASGSGLTGIVVSAYSTNGVLAGSGKTGAGGSYQLSQLPASSYFVRTYSDWMGFVDEWHDNVALDSGGIPSSALAVTVTNGGIAYVDFELGFLVMTTACDKAGFCMGWQAASGTTYQVFLSGDLVTWTNAPSGTNAVEKSHQQAAAQGLLEYRDGTSTTNPAFYRVRIETP